MLNTRLFGNALKDLGYDFFSGVPCSFLQGLINFAVSEFDYVMAANEGDAVAVCAGAYLGGRRPVFLCQNSGLTNALSPLTSLNDPFRIPLLGFVSLRGEAGTGDEPQHELMGAVTGSLIETIRVKYGWLSPEWEQAREQLRFADQIIKQGKSYFFIVRKGIFEDFVLLQNPVRERKNPVVRFKSRADALPRRFELLKVLMPLKDSETVFLATTGKTGRELYSAGDSRHNLYMVGSMGCVASLGLGLALAKPDRYVFTLDGDGALLMRMGAMATLAYYQPARMIHILLDNNAHESTGGQPTVSHHIDFVSLAAALGYPRAFYAHDSDELAGIAAEWKRDPALTFVEMKIAKGSPPNLGRPEIKPWQVKERFMAFLEGAV